MKSKRDVDGGKARVYVTTTYVPELRTAFARLYRAWKERGQKKDEFLALLSEAGYPVPERTLNQWTASVRSDGSATRPVKRSGRPPALSEDLVRLLVGYVLHQNDANVEVHLNTAQMFLRDELHVEVALPSVGRYLHDQGFTSKAMQSKTAGYQVDSAQLCHLALDWLRRTPLDVVPSRLCSINFTFTGHRTDRCTSFSLSGAPQPRSGVAASTYTNCILTCVWADGVNRTPAVLFTLDQRFRFDRNPTAKRNAEVAYLEECLTYYDLDADHIEYIGKLKGEKGIYASECADLVRRFFAKYEVPKGCTVLSDNGKSFLEDGEDVLEVLGFKHHACYPAAVHQYLSPNDNRLHGAAKKAWRESGVDFSDDVLACCYLLNLLDWCNKDVPTYFDRNLQLQQEAPTRANVANLIRGKRVSESPYYQDCLREYRVFMHLDASNERTDAASDLGLEQYGGPRKLDRWLR